jgi:DNA-binding MarR family transcriptional regulator
MLATSFSRDKTLEVARSCVCLHVQRAARALARRFDEVFGPLDLTNGQFSLLMSVNRSEPPTIGQLASFLAMDRTTLTALVKPLERKGLLEVLADPGDRRKRRLRLTADGHSLLKRAYPRWREAHADLDRQMGDADTLRALLLRIAPVPLAADLADEEIRILRMRRPK